MRVCDLAKSVQDDLLRQVRRKLRQDHGFPRDVAADFGVPCVYSPEKPAFPWSNGTCSTKQKEPGTVSLATLDCASGFGAPASFVTGAFGFAAAGEVVQQAGASHRGERPRK